MKELSSKIHADIDLYNSTYAIGPSKFSSDAKRIKERITNNKKAYAILKSEMERRKQNG